MSVATTFAAPPAPVFVTEKEWQNRVKDLEKNKWISTETLFRMYQIAAPLLDAYVLAHAVQHLSDNHFRTVYEAAGGASVPFLVPKIFDYFEEKETNKKEPQQPVKEESSSPRYVLWDQSQVQKRLDSFRSAVFHAIFEKAIRQMMFTQVMIRHLPGVVIGLILGNTLKDRVSKIF